MITRQNKLVSAAKPRRSGVALRLRGSDSYGARRNPWYSHLFDSKKEPYKASWDSPLFAGEILLYFAAPIPVILVEVGFCHSVFCFLKDEAISKNVPDIVKKQQQTVMGESLLFDWLNS
ncbi:hypothetical protein Y032_0074g867 [Ancylostoma ceylanicum]|uniref:Uncharacterized protein n=1 Tax=Ancylostoma ceylanicum TaxID=53326 RepID=A0A016TVF1_9BILA|nr:hypothetical protein Y032_0074g867 [Ancylostoma ceylanicum]